MNSMQFQQDIKKARHNFLVDAQVDAAILPENILESWQRSKQLGIDPLQQSFPLVTSEQKNKTIGNIESFANHMKENFGQVHSLLKQILAEVGAAVFYMDDNLCVFNKYGNEDLLQELKGKNIRFGTNFSEDIMGTNAVAIAQRTEKNNWVIGYEHYSEALCSYACYARSAVRNICDKHYYVLLIIPCAGMTNATIPLFHYIIESYTKAVSYHTFPDIAIERTLLRHIMQQNSSAYVVINPSEQVLLANDLFFSVFHKIPSKTIGSHLVESIPDFKQISEYLARGQEVLNYEIIFPSLPKGSQSYLIDCFRINQFNTYLGIAIVLKNKNDFYKHINKIVNSGSYYSLNDLIGESENFVALKKMIRQSALSSSNVLITGESGTGKELIAQSIHSCGPRSEHPFVSLNCAAIPKELIGSELFGYVEGAFTGAKKGGATGKFELAHEGTLFLDEIGDMPLDLQAVLLRVLEDRTVTRIGGSKSTKVNVRILAATNCNLWERVNERQFRSDLYYRLNVIRLDTIPLRQRLDDLPLLVNHFLHLLSKSFHKEILAVSPEVMDLFYQYNWPGNVRELRNILERCITFCNSPKIQIENIPQDFFNTINKQTQPDHNLSFSEVYSMDLSFEEYERKQILYLMRKHKGNKSMVAKELGIARRTLYSRLEKYNC
jgi:Transcriptional regulator containing PAS, AAA-type ATPase, and DNA-binding domains